MPLSSSSATSDDRNYSQEIQQFVAELAQNPDREQVASEIEVLQSIYGEDAVRLWDGNGNGHLEAGTIRYQVILSLSPPHEDISVSILISVPPTYPVSSPPQLQLLSRYIGAFGADSNLFGSILRTFISVNGVEWATDTVCVFDGLQNVLEKCTTWYQDRLSTEMAGKLLREDQKEHTQAAHTTSSAAVSQKLENEIPELEFAPTELPAGVVLYVADPILDRKSAFVGRACRISHPSEVPLVLSYLMSDRRISRAAHPIINAWRCQVGSVLHQDNDDDGETAAGGRLAHLLQILEINDVLVVVTRYFGGIHLGPDRFKHINQAARNALDLGGFLDTTEASKKHALKGRKH
ncbi:imprinted and ancient [Cyathus striatus]|nr:imprinted and ancient [Cyathus striatus]